MELSEIFAKLESDVRLAPTKEQIKAESFRADGALASAAEAMRFIMGGKATVTLVSKKTSSRFTYRIRASEDRRVFFVSVLNGPDNWTNYAYIGYIRGGIYFHGGPKAKVAADAPSAKAFAWTFAKLAKDQLPDALEIWHEGKCGRCGRKLTVPSSIASGFGPECEGRL